MKLFDGSRIHAFAALMYLVAILTACQGLGLPTATTFNEKLATGYGSVTAVRQAALGLLQGGKLTPDDAQNIQTQADTAKAALDIARTTHLTDPAAGDTKLTSAITILTALQAYVNSKQGGK